MNYENEIKNLGPWFHNLHLPDGTQTAPNHPLGDFPLFKWKEIAPCIPKDLSGWNVIDIGCNAGFYSFELAKRGAQVLAIDIDTHYLNQAVWAAKQFGLTDKIVFKKMQVYDIARMEKSFDIVWFMGVFYHLRYPLLSFDIISRHTKNLMVFQTMTMPDTEKYEHYFDLDLSERHILLQPGWPKMSFVENCIAGDPTNWWVPNHNAVASMLKSCGFRIITRPASEIYICEMIRKQLDSSDIREQEYRAATGQNGKYR